MIMLWRVQQAQMIISIVFWSLTLTGIFYPYIRARILNDWIGSENVFLGMALIFSVVIFIVIIFGYLYDRLAFWREQITVAQERNPFSYGSRVTPVQFVLFNAILNPDDEDAQRKARALLTHQLKDPKFKMTVQDIDSEIGGDNES